MLAAIKSLPDLRAAVDTGAVSDAQAWPDALRAHLHDPPGGHLNARTADQLLSWATDEPDAARATLADLLDDREPLGVRVQHFSTAVASSVRNRATRITVASHLLMTNDPTRYPVYRVPTVRAFLGLLGLTEHSGDGTRYEHWVQLTDDLMAEFEQRTAIRLRDRLDAVVIIDVITGLEPNSELIRSWSDEDRAAFFQWRDGLDTSTSHESSGRTTATTGADADDDISMEGRPDPLETAARRTHLPVSCLRTLRELLADKGQLVLYGPPGTGKTYVAQELALALAGGDPDGVTIVQFHPSTTYEDFVEGIRPSTDGDGAIRYDVVAGPLVRLADRARTNPDRTFVMVIDELNRANLPKVLGELLFLFEYRDRQVTTLYRPDEPFSLPRNLVFVATMNTIDRSVALVDAAMRRRFHFVPFYPDSPQVCDVLASVCSDDEAWVAELVETVNAELVDKLGSRDHQLGASHFITADRTLAGIERVWRYSIEPTIEDHLFGDDHRMAEFRWDAVRQRHLDDLLGDETGDAEPSSG